MTSPIENISDTAFWVAADRALETEHPKSSFKDPFARMLAGERGDEIRQKLGNKEVDRLSLITRSCLIDKLILGLIEKQGVDTVLNLGAGLDTRPYRLCLPSSLNWIEVDFPDILSYKQQKLANQIPVCSLELVKLDLADIHLRKTLFSRVNNFSKQVLVLTEGLLAYLTSAQVASLAIDLHAQSNFRWWLFEQISPLILISNQKKYDKYLAVSNARMQFAPKEGVNFFLRYGWNLFEIHSIWKEMHRFNHSMTLTWLLWMSKLLARFFAGYREIMEQSANIVLLEKVQS